MLPLSLPSTAPPALAHPSPPPFEVADIVRAYGAAFPATHPVSHEQARVLRAIAQCRTAALGGHVEQCVSCGTERVCYDSCRNRHCPKCQGSARAKWLAAEQALLLPIPYFHVVFVGNGVVRFRYTDYATGGTAKGMELRAEEFLRRFLLHVVPTGFVRIRHYGLLANRTRQAKLARARQFLAIGAATPLLSPVSVSATDMASSPTAAARCPLCAGTHWRIIARLVPQRGHPP